MFFIIFLYKRYLTLLLFEEIIILIKLITLSTRIYHI